MALSTDQYGYLIDPLVPITDATGTTIKDGFLRVYIAGSSTPVITYRNYDGAMNEQTIELDNSGRCKYPVIVSKSLAYKVVVYDAQHSQETPIITIDKMFAIGASVTAGAGSTIVQGLDNVEGESDGFVKASVTGTTANVKLDATNVSHELTGDAAVGYAANAGYMVPALSNDPDDPGDPQKLPLAWIWANKSTQVVLTPADFLGAGLSNDEWAAAVAAISGGKTAVVKWTESGASRVAVSSLYEAGVGLVFVAEYGGFVTEYVVASAPGAHAVTTNVYDHNGDTFEEVNDLMEASDFNADDELLVVSPNSTRKMLWTTLANKVLGFIKNLPTTITSFRTGDVIPVDGPSGTAKMSKDDLLRVTAENAVNSGVAASRVSFDKFHYRKYGTNKVIINFTKGSYLSKSDGSLVANANGYYTDYVEITSDFYFCINAKTAALTCMVAVYDANKDFLASVGKNSSALDWNDVIVSSADLKSQNPTAKYLRFGSYGKVGSYVYQMDSVYDSDSGFDALEKNITENKIEATAKRTGTIGTSYPVIDGKFLGYTIGDERSSAGCQCTDYIDISDIECFNIIGKSQYDVAIMCIYDGNKNFLASFGHTTGETVEWTNKKIFVDELKLEFPLFNYARFSTINTPLTVQTFTPSSLDDVYAELKNGLNAQSNSVYGSYTSSGITTLETHGFINKNTGVFTEYSAAVATDYVDVSSYIGKILAVTGEANFNTCLLALYDSSQNFLASIGKTDLGVAVVWTVEKVDIDALLETYPTLKYLRFSGLDTSSSKPLNISVFTPFTIDNLVDDVLKCNSLYGKKWVACGDSFTHGGNVAVDPITGLHKSYPYWIATRNKMNLVMMAKSGETIHNRDDNTNEFTPTRYLSIPSDADIITLSWGLNETGVTIGDSSSSDDTTLWGAFNEVISFILANNPKCKIGIIIQDGWMTQTIADAEKAIGEYWGIPVLDLKFDKNVPLGIYGRPNVSTDAINARNGVFMDASNHPTEEGHKYRSTFIENWLRSL